MLNLTVQDLVLKKEEKTFILKGIGANFESGKLNAIMGHKGSGKKALLDILAGKTSRDLKISGTILLNGRERTEQWFEDTGHISENTYLEENLKVSEILQFYSEMVTTNSQEVSLNFNSVVELLNLEEILISPIINLSRLDRIVVKIAIELISQRKIIILDEPILNLNSEEAVGILEKLAKIARELDICIIFTVEKPDDQIFEKFDRLVLIKNGKSIYNGECVKIFEFLREKRIHLPENWRKTDFLFELFYNLRKHKDLGYKRTDIEALLVEHVKKSDEIVANSSLKSMTSKISLNFSFNFSQVAILVKKFCKVSFKKPKIRNFIFLMSLIPLFITLTFETENFISKHTSEVNFPALQSTASHSYNIAIGYTDKFEKQVMESIKNKKISEVQDKEPSIDTKNIELAPKDHENFLFHFNFYSACLVISIVKLLPLAFDYSSNQLDYEISRKLYSPGTLFVAEYFYLMIVHFLIFTISTISLFLTGVLYHFPVQNTIIYFCLFILITPFITLMDSCTFRCMTSDVFTSRLFNFLNSCISLPIIVTPLIYSKLIHKVDEFPKQVGNLAKLILGLASFMNPWQHIYGFIKSHFFLKFINNKSVRFIELEQTFRKCTPETPISLKEDEDTLFFIKFLYTKNPFRLSNVKYALDLYDSAYSFLNYSQYSQLYFILGFLFSSLVSIALIVILFNLKFGTKRILNP